MNNYVDGDGMPLGLGMALAQNKDALNQFAGCTPEQKQRIINHTHSIHSKKEMAAFAQQIAQGTFL